jgi:hypothetical protein
MRELNDQISDIEPSASLDPKFPTPVSAKMVCRSGQIVRDGDSMEERSNSIGRAGERTDSRSSAADGVTITANETVKRNLEKIMMGKQNSARLSNVNQDTASNALS